MNPIEQAVAPLRDEAVTEARGRAERFILDLYRKLEQDGWDLNKTAPFPASTDREYKAKRQFRNSATQIVDSVEFISRPGAPHPVRINPAKESRFIQVACDAAASGFDAYVEKLIDKVGPVDSAELWGDRVWGESELKVKKGDVIEYWLTQQILNFSPLGTPYNQWPTRKVKRNW